MPITTTVKFKGHDIEVKELTVEQLEQMSADTSEMTWIDRVFNPDMVTEKMLELSTGLSSEELRSTAPSEIRPLVEAAKEVNKDLFLGLKSLARQA